MQKAVYLKRINKSLEMKKIFKPILSIAIVAGLIFWGCKKDDPDNVNPDPNEDKIALDVNTDGVSETQNRVNYVYEPLFDTAYNPGFKSTKDLGGEDMFILIAEVESPVRSGDRVLSATHVEVNGNYAYVSYHYNEPNGSAISEDLYEGHIDVFDITEPTVPVIMSTAETHRADFNTMFLDYETEGAQRKLWIGATDYGVGGAVFELDLMDNTIPVGSMLSRYKTPPGFSVNGVVRSADWIYATAGRTAGGVYTFDEATMNLAQVDEFTNAKYAAASGTDIGSKHVALKSGTSAELLVYEVSEEHTLLNTIDIGSIAPENGKSGIYIKDNICWVAMGYNGLKAYDLNTGNLVHTLSPENMGPDAVTNGVCLDEDYVYIANGSGGMYLCEIVDGQQEIEVLEIYDYGASANYIDVGNNMIFIANGREGLKILRRVPPGDYTVICDYDENGVPYCIEENLDPLCEDLLGHLAVALPESEDAWVTHPEYFTNPNTNVVLTEEATVYVTFIDEGAGWKNSLGTYTYDAATPPMSVADIAAEKMLIYPNASKVGSGGALQAGNTMRLLGTFPEGTAIGSFLVANSWRGLQNVPGGLTEGYYTQYTNVALNQNELQQSLLFYDATCDAIILTFEDIKIPAGDKDYNDCIFKVIVDPPTAVNTDLFIPLGE